MNTFTRKKYAFTLLTLISILVASNIYTLIPIYEAVAIDLDISSVDVVIAGSLFTLFYAGGLLSFGPISNYVGRKKILVYGLLISSVTTFAVGFATGAITLWLTRSIQGFTLASFASVVFAYSFEMFPTKPRTLLVVLINTGFLIAGIFGQLISSLLSYQFSWNSVFFFFAFCYLLLFVLAFIILADSPINRMKKEPVLAVYFSLIKDSLLAKCYVITFSLLFSVIAFYDALNRYFPGANEDLFMIRTAGLIGATLSIFTGKFIEKLGELKTLEAGFIIGILSFIAMLFYHRTAELIVFSILFISSTSLVIPTVITLIGSFVEKKRSQALSLYSFILLIGASLGPSLASFASFHQILIVLSMLFLLNLWLCQLIKNLKIGS